MESCANVQIYSEPTSFQHVFYGKLIYGYRSFGCFIVREMSVDEHAFAENTREPIKKNMDMTGVFLKFFRSFALATTVPEPLPI